MRIAKRSIAVLCIGLAGLLALAWAAGPGAESLADAAAAEPGAAGKSAGGSAAVMVTAAPAALRPVERTVDIVGTLAGFVAMGGVVWSRIRAARVDVEGRLEHEMHLVDDEPDAAATRVAEAQPDPQPEATKR